MPFLPAKPKRHITNEYELDRIVIRNVIPNLIPAVRVATGWRYYLLVPNPSGPPLSKIAAENYPIAFSTIGLERQLTYADMGAWLDHHATQRTSRHSDGKLREFAVELTFGPALPPTKPVYYFNELPCYLFGIRELA